MMDDVNHQQMATNLATQLLQQLDAKIASTPNDPDKFLMKSNLQKISENLKVGPIFICKKLFFLLTRFIIIEYWFNKCHSSHHFNKKYITDVKSESFSSYVIYTFCHNYKKDVMRKFFLSCLQHLKVVMGDKSHVLNISYKLTPCGVCNMHV